MGLIDKAGSAAGVPTPPLERTVDIPRRWCLSVLVLVLVLVHCECATAFIEQRPIHFARKICHRDEARLPNQPLNRQAQAAP